MMKKFVSAPNVKIITADALTLPLSGTFDRVLADVPCSGTGTLPRNPEIKWKLKPSDIDDLHGRQVAILSAALDKVSPQGRLVYSTCSLEEKENRSVVEDVLREKPNFRLLDCGPLIEELKAKGDLVLPEIASLIEGPFLRTLPGVLPCDGFFAAVIERKRD
jgi:16S rRNA (cytosine967-C5)-methyltransferase